MTPAKDLGDRLEKLPELLSEKSFLTSSGIGNEIAFYIFAFEPEHQPIIDNYLPRMKERLKAGADVHVAEFNLYDLILDILRTDGLLEKTFEIEAKKGTQGVGKALAKKVRPEKLVQLIEKRLTEPHDLVFLTGVGAAYPLIRSHTVLNNLHPVMDRVPVVMFFPGSYDGSELRLFNTLKDDNYYRAFPLL